MSVCLKFVRICHVRHTLALMCAKNHLLIFSSFLDIWENVEWLRFLDHPVDYSYLQHTLNASSDCIARSELLRIRTDGSGTTEKFALKKRDRSRPTLCIKKPDPCFN